MNEPTNPLSTRRDFLKNTGKAAAATAIVGAAPIGCTTRKVATGTALAGVAVPHVHAAGSDTIRVALVGCGGRGTGAAANALKTSNQGPIKLVAMADVFESKMNNAAKTLKEQFPDQFDVPADRQYIGFDSYQKAMSHLKPGDVAISATPPAFRWVHFSHAIEKNLNLFMEKPVTVDGPTSVRMLKLNEEAVRKNLKVGIGLMCRHCKARKELFERVQNGEIGDIIMLRAYRMAGPLATCFSGPKPSDISELHYQIQRFHSFLWASGGAFSDFNIHNIDEACWMKNAWPVQAHATGGRHNRGDNIDQNFDNYSVEYTFDDGTKFYMYGRNIAGCNDEFATYVHGSKGLGIVSTAGHIPAKSRIFSGHKITKAGLAWAYPQPEPNPYQLEWDNLIEAIRKDQPYNEVKRGVEVSVVTSMGRMAAHTGQVVTFDDMLNHEHEFAPNVDKLVLNGPAPLLADATGKYPVPEPGVKKKREY